ncbi:MAG TPA: nitroreductase family protein [Dehalococcoidia bacterium]|nr:nitroreductase family protein [Dehalococcoidia bacterium]
MEAILSRRSIRRYSGESVSEELIKELLQAAMSAPSASNEQPWQFVIIDDRRILDEIPRFHPYAHMLKEASWAIAVCGDLNLEMMSGYWIQDCSAATQNILLAAHARGLGAVWLGVYPNGERVKTVQKLLGLPENVMPLCFISIGYPAEKKPPSNRYNESRVHHNHW